MENVHTIYMNVIGVCILIVFLLVLLVFLQKKKESFQTGCSFTVNVYDPKTNKTNRIPTNVADYLSKNPVMASIGNIPANYDSNQTTQSSQRLLELTIARANIQLFKDVLNALYTNRTQCRNDYLVLANAYASRNGLLGSTTEQGQFEVVQVGLQLFGCHLVITDTLLPRKPYEAIESWIAAVSQRFAPSFGGRANNQFLFYTAGMMSAAVLQKKRDDLNAMANALVQHMRTPSGRGNFRRGFIVSELDRFAKVIDYHAYYMHLLWCNLLIIRTMNVSFPWQEFREPLRLVCASLADKSTNTKGDASLFINFLKTQTGSPMNSYTDATVYNEMRNRTLANGGVHMNMWQYLFNNGPMPKGFTVSGVNIETSLFVKALQFWNSAVFPK